MKNVDSTGGNSTLYNGATGVDCFIMFGGSSTEATVRSLKNSDLCNDIFIICNGNQAEGFSQFKTVFAEKLWNTQTLRNIASLAKADYTLIYIQPEELELGANALERMVNIAKDSSAGMAYSDYNERKDEGKAQPHPLIDYRKGSLRDDFNFGSLLVFKTSILRDIADSMEDYRYAALYSLRLNVSRSHPIVHINEYLYTVTERDLRTSGEKLFDYVDPKNREVQVEMEKVCTEHLKKINGYLPPNFKPIDFDIEIFETEASVIIPVRNRVHTIGDAICSALKQETTFNFNVIVIDNHSTDGTTDEIKKYSSADKRLIHIIPEREDLGIGGCWNEGVSHKSCGKFAVQLDSDDVYSDCNSLQKTVNAFYEQRCAMVVGTYQMTDINWQNIPPGIIDHREWTHENGRNNALRINGLGAPRAFYTPLVRRFKFPNTSYGEDYAMGLRISRDYSIGRIYEVLYLCRRWEGNSDAKLDIQKANGYNAYKDNIRSWELEARIQKNINS